MKKRFVSCATVLVAWTALAAQTDDLCWAQKQELMTSARRVARPGAPAVRLGLTPLIFLAFIEGSSEEVNSIDDMAQVLARIRPGLGSPGNIRIRLVRAIQQEWEEGVRNLVSGNERLSNTELLRTFHDHLRSVFRQGYRFALLDTMDDGPRLLAEFVAGENRTVYEFTVQGRETGRTINITQHVDDVLPGDGNPHTVRRLRFRHFPMEDFIERFFSRQGMVQHARALDPITGRAFTADFFDYLHQIRAVDLTDDDLLRFLAGRDGQLYAVLRQALAEGGEAGLRRALAQASANAITRRSRAWIVVGGIALVAGVVVAWVQGPDELEKFAAHFAEKFPGTAESPAQAETLSQAFKIQDADTLAQTIHGWGCGNVGALWHAVFDNGGYAYGG